MADYWTECFDPTMAVSPKDFAATFCKRCINLECERSVGGRDRWAHRMATQIDRLIENPKFADPRDPAYRDIRAIDFPSAVREAMRLEISDKRGDWSIPSEADAMQMASQMAASMLPTPVPKVLRSVDVQGSHNEVYQVRLMEEAGGQPAWTCTCEAFRFGRARPCKHVEYASSLAVEESPEVEEASTQGTPPPRFVSESATPTRPFFPSRENIAMPSGGIMVDGSPPPPPRHRPTPVVLAADPWAIPMQKDTIVPVGGRVVLGGHKDEKK